MDYIKELSKKPEFFERQNDIEEILRLAVDSLRDSLSDLANLYGEVYDDETLQNFAETFKTAKSVAMNLFELKEKK